MPDNWDDVNLGNPSNSRRDAEERNDAKVTNADHPVGDNVGAAGKAEEKATDGADDLFDDTVKSVAKNDPRGPSVPPAGHAKADTHAETIRNPELEMPGERTSHVDPLSGDTGLHLLGVGMGAAAGGAAAGAAAGMAAGAVAGPFGAALGAALGTTIGAMGGGYAGKHLAEKVNPTTEDHYWRHEFSKREYVPRGAKYEEWEPAYEYGIEMREWLIDKTWEEAHEMIRAGWEESETGKAMPWEKARPAIQDAWDHLTPDPGEEEVTDAEREGD